MTNDLSEKILHMLPHLGGHGLRREAMQECGLFSRDCAVLVMQYLPEGRRRREPEPDLSCINMICKTNLTKIRHKYGWLIYCQDYSTYHYYFDLAGKFICRRDGCELIYYRQVRYDLLATNIVGDGRILRIVEDNIEVLVSGVKVLPRSIMTISNLLPCGLALLGLASGTVYLMNYPHAIELSFSWWQLNRDQFERIDDFGTWK